MLRNNGLCAVTGWGTQVAVNSWRVWLSPITMVKLMAFEVELSKESAPHECLSAVPKSVDSQVFAGGKVALGQIRKNDIKVCQRHLRRSLTGCLLSPFSGLQLPHESFALPIPPFEPTTIKKGKYHGRILSSSKCSNCARKVEVCGPWIVSSK
jgi:hypothetical protein